VDVVAYVPGKVLQVKVAVGGTIKEEQEVMVIESMKMETKIYAESAGRVSEIKVAPGCMVKIGDVLLVLE